MADEKKYVTLTEDNFQSEVLESPRPVLVDFWAGWCGPCRIIAPTIEELAAEFEGTAKVGKVDVDSNQNLAAKFGIASIPTLLFFQNGKVVEQVIGVASKPDLAEKLKNLVTAGGSRAEAS